MARFKPVVVVVLLAVAGTSVGLDSGTDLVVPAAIHAPGTAGAVWRSDLYVHNPGAEATGVVIEWLVRDQANPSPATHQLRVEAGATAVLEDVVAAIFGEDPGYGAFRVRADRSVLVSSAVVNLAGGSELGQGFEAVPVTSAIRAGAAAVGLKHDDSYRSNLFLLDVSGVGSEVVVALVDPQGVELADRAYSLGPWMPVLDSVASLGVSSFTDATLVVTVTTGAVVAGASRVNAASGDPLTLAAARTGNVPLTAGTYRGTVADAGGFLGGMALVLDRSEAITGLDFTFPSALCDVTFGAAHDLGGSPIPLVDLASGVVLTATYPDGGQMTWTLLAHRGDGASPHLTGTLSALGAGWTGTLVACNGEHPAAEVRLGVETQ